MHLNGVLLGQQLHAAIAGSQVNLGPFIGQGAWLVLTTNLQLLLMAKEVSRVDIRQPKLKAPYLCWHLLRPQQRAG